MPSKKALLNLPRLNNRGAIMKKKRKDSRRLSFPRASQSKALLLREKVRLALRGLGLMREHAHSSFALIRRLLAMMSFRLRN